MHRTRWAWAVLAAGLLVAEARACPVCETEAGARVRSHLFGPDFTANLVATLLPFPILFGIVGLIHHGPPGRRSPEAGAGGRTEDGPMSEDR